MTGALPEGVVTFLFTDIEGSTRLLTDIGDAAYGEALGAHRDIVSGAAAAQGGVTVRIRGRRRLRRLPDSRRGRPVCRRRPAGPRRPRVGRR